MKNLELNRKNYHLHKLDIPKKIGCYVLGMNIKNPITGEETYLIKIGKAQNIHERIKLYNTYNPAVCLLGVLDDYEKENDYQKKLIQYCSYVAKGSSEWFELKKEFVPLLIKDSFFFLKENSNTQFPTKEKRFSIIKRIKQIFTEKESYS